jgi:Spy/CpxP family protein refolding chaperone
LTNQYFFSGKDVDMRTNLATLLTLALAPLCAGTLFTGTAAGQASREREASRDRGAAAERIQERLHDLNLTDDQEAKLSAIRKEYRPTVEASAKELATLVREEVEKIRGVLTVEQIDRLQEMNGERKERRAESLAERIAHLEELDVTAAEMASISEIRSEYRPKMGKSLEVLKGLLTDEQRLARDQAWEAGKKHREIIASVKLTGEQKERVASAAKQIRSLVKEEIEDLRDVLSAEQQEKVADSKSERRERVRDRLAHTIANCKELGLTEDQKTKIASIRDEYRPKVHEAGNKMRTAIRGELQAVADVLKS